MFIRVLPCFVNVTNMFFKFMDPYLWSSLYNETMGKKSRISHKLGMVNMKSPDIIKVMVAKNCQSIWKDFIIFTGVDSQIR